MDRYNFIEANAKLVMQCRAAMKEYKHDEPVREMFQRQAYQYEEVIIRRARYLMGESP